MCKFTTFVVVCWIFPKYFDVIFFHSIVFFGHYYLSFFKKKRMYCFDICMGTYFTPKSSLYLHISSIFLQSDKPNDSTQLLPSFLESNLKKYTCLKIFDGKQQKKDFSLESIHIPIFRTQIVYLFS